MSYNETAEVASYMRWKIAIARTRAKHAGSERTRRKWHKEIQRWKKNLRKLEAAVP